MPKVSAAFGFTVSRLSLLSVMFDGDEMDHARIGLSDGEKGGDLPHFNGKPKRLGRPALRNSAIPPWHILLAHPLGTSYLAHLAHPPGTASQWWLPQSRGFSIAVGAASDTALTPDVTPHRTLSIPKPT